MELHASGENYLTAILILEKQNENVRSIDVAHYLGRSKPSVSRAVSILQGGGFLKVEKRRFLHLTDSGRQIAEKIYERRRFFTERLIAIGVDPKTAEADACQIEHIVSDESFARLKDAVK